MQSSSEQPLVGEERYVTTRITAAKETKSPGVKILCVLYLPYDVTLHLNAIEIPETKCFIPKGFELGTTLSWPIWSIRTKSKICLMLTHKFLRFRPTIPILALHFDRSVDCL